MKYLKTYRLFEGVARSLQEDIEDILLDLTDSGYTFEAQWHQSNDTYPYVLIEPEKMKLVGNKYIGFDTSEVDDVVKRIVERCDETGWDVQTEFGYSYCMISFIPY